MAFYSSGVEYGIHSLMTMVDAKGNDREMSVREMAALQGVPYDYLGKIFTRLSRAGLVSSTEGKGGGFRLARVSGWPCLMKRRLPGSATGRAVCAR